MNLWPVVIVAGVLTFLIRLSFISMLANWEMPPLFQRALGFVPPAVLTAIVFPELLIRDGHFAVNMENHRLTAGVIAILVAWRFKKIMPTIVAGMAVLWLLQYFGN
ncbi:MAG TPA: AzlD domain-containing protein [Burkholderiales bacterium]|jgi:branched-subunit amino acid transport protein|nr:AzlD domain-containing protein [Burkholderiales bacterium]